MILVFAVALMVSSGKMLIFTLNSGRPWYMSGGLFPLIIGAGLFTLALMLIKAAAGSAKDLTAAVLWRELVKSQPARSFFFVTALSALYMALMKYSYPVSTGLYLFILMNYVKRSLWLAGLVSVAATSIIIVLFQALAQIPLP